MDSLEIKFHHCTIIPCPTCHPGVCMIKGALEALGAFFLWYGVGWMLLIGGVIVGSTIDVYSKKPTEHEVRWQARCQAVGIPYWMRCDKELLATSGALPMHWTGHECEEYKQAILHMEELVRRDPNHTALAQSLIENKRFYTGKCNTSILTKENTPKTFKVKASKQMY